MQNNECIKEKIGEHRKKLGERGGSIVWVYDCMVFKYPIIHTVIHPNKSSVYASKLLLLQNELL